MKNWRNAEIVELNINETAQGGKDSTRVDGMWTDRNTGNAWASFASGGNAGGPEIDVKTNTVEMANMKPPQFR